MFGELFKSHRLALGMTLREFCSKRGHDAGNISRLERGKVPPPESEEILEGYAHDLRLDPGTEKWQAFMDAACAERGKVPSDLMSDAELVEKLPILFRSLRDADNGKRRDALRRLAEQIRKT